MAEGRADKGWSKPWWTPVLVNSPWDLVIHQNLMKDCSQTGLLLFCVPIVELFHETGLQSCDLILILRGLRWDSLLFRFSLIIGSVHRGQSGREMKVQFSLPLPRLLLEGKHN